MNTASKRLVDLALLQNPDNLVNLQSQDWWNNYSQAARTEAYAEIQRILGSPQAMADYAKEKNIQNLQNYSWWSSSPHKQQAWKIIDPSYQIPQQTPTASPTGSSTPAPTGSSTPTQNSPLGGQNQYRVDWIMGQIANRPAELEYILKTGKLPVRYTGFDVYVINEVARLAREQFPEQYQQLQGQQNQTPVTDPLNPQNPEGSLTAPKPKPAQTGDSLKDAQKIIDASGLPDSVKAMFKNIVVGWDLSKDVNFDTIVEAFQKEQQNTIDPAYYEMANIALDEVNRAKDFQIAANKREDEAIQAKASEDIKNASNSLEARGMSFTGEAAATLGATSAFTPVAGEVPTIPFGGVLPEGTVHQSNRLMATSAAARQQNDLTELQRSAEKYFGSTGKYTMVDPVTGQNKAIEPGAMSMIPGASGLGGMTGTLEQKRIQDYANTLNQLGGQQNQNFNYQDPIKFNF